MRQSRLGFGGIAMSLDRVVWSRLTELLVRILQSELTDEQFGELKSMLASHPEARQYYAEFMALCAQLRKYHVRSHVEFPSTESAPQEDAPATKRLAESGVADKDAARVAEIKRVAEARLQAFLAEQEAMRRQAAAGQPSRGRDWNLHGAWLRFRHVLAWACRATVATAAILVLLLIGVHGVRYLRGHRVVASLTRTVDARWTTPPTEAVLHPGPLELQEGYAQLTFNRGAQVILHAPCSISLESPERLVLYRGRVTSNVPKAAVGFTVETLHVKVVDYGTEFGVTVQPDGRSQAAVFTGSVHVAPRSRKARNRAATVREGQQIQTSTTGELGKATALQPGQGYRRSWHEVLYQVETSGQCRVRREPPADVQYHALENDNAVAVFLERTNVQLAEDWEGLFTIAGRRYGDADHDLADGVVRAGTRVDSYLIHLDPVGSWRGKPMWCRGGIRFPRPILGVIHGTERLLRSDAVFGAPDTLYPASDRGIENDVDPDVQAYKEYVQIGADRRTLRFEMAASETIDQVRVIIEGVTDSLKGEPSQAD
jgi:hypothetical protein